MITDLRSRFGLQRSVFQSKVARRVFTLFVFAALAPILVIAALFYVQTGLRNDHSEKQRLHATTKAMGMQLLSEFQDVQDRLKYLSTLSPAQRTDAFRKIVGDKVVTYGVFVSADQIDGVPGDYPAIPSEVRERAARGHPTLLARTAGTAGADVYMAVPALVPPSAVMLAKLNMKTLGVMLKDDDSSELCILTDQHLPTYCDPRIPRRVLASLHRVSASSDMQNLSWTSRDTTWRGGSWTLYTEPRYHLRTLTLLWAVPAAYLDRGQSRFDKILLPTVVFTLLVVILLSINLIRRILAPLDLLKTATRILATGDFSCRVNTQSGDEFDELAGSFNVMAADIDRQFQEIDTMAELDRRVLSAQGTEEIMSVLLTRLPEIAASDGVAIIVLEGEQVQTEGWHLNGKMASFGGTDEAKRVDSALLESLRTCQNHLQMDSADDAPLLRPFFDAGMHKALCLPVAQQDTVSAIICLGYRDPAAGTGEGVAHVQRIADHAALAFSNAAWEEKLYQQAHYDALTGLPNRQLFTSRLDEAVAAARRRGKFVALLFIDVDRFKTLNDTVGHNAGDDYLVAAGRAMRACVTEDATLARLGGDEFTVIIPNIPNAQQALEVSEDAAERIRKSFLRPVTIEGQDVALSASIGIAICPTDAESRVALLRCADQAMYYAKDRGRNAWSYYSEEINASALERLELGAALAGALERHELSLYLQPQVEAVSGRLCSAEVLLRWHHPKLGTVPPSKFIPVAEQSGLITGIGAWVLEQACLHMRTWQSTGKSNLSLAINVSALQLRQSNYVQSVIETIDRYGVDPRLIELEVTESLCAEDVGAASALFRTLKGHGLAVSIDDFGTGYSSMRYLRDFPIDTIKIDQAFVRGLPADPFNKAITEAILTMAQNLGCSVVAEGVETEAQLEFLRGTSCEKIQGYYIARPMPIPEFERWAERRLREARSVANLSPLQAVRAGAAD